MLRHRTYKSGTRWGLWLWTDVDNEFIRRLHVIKTPWFAICLHWILKPDPEPWLHDHPVSFLSIVLKGWYKEKRKVYVRDFTLGFVGDEDRSGKRKWWNFIRASIYDRHTITECDPGTVTLCFMGPKVREWGYHLKEDDSVGEGASWVYWKDYAHGKYRNGETQ